MVFQNKLAITLLAVTGLALSSLSFGRDVSHTLNRPLVDHFTSHTPYSKDNKFVASKQTPTPQVQTQAIATPAQSKHYQTGSAAGNIVVHGGSADSTMNSLLALRLSIFKTHGMTRNTIDYPEKMQGFISGLQQAIAEVPKERIQETSLPPMPRSQLHDPRTWEQAKHRQIGEYVGTLLLKGGEVQHAMDHINRNHLSIIGPHSIFTKNMISRPEKIRGLLNGIYKAKDSAQDQQTHRKIDYLLQRVALEYGTALAARNHYKRLAPHIDDVFNGHLEPLRYIAMGAADLEHRLSRGRSYSHQHDWAPLIEQRTPSASREVNRLQQRIAIEYGAAFGVRNPYYTNPYKINMHLARALPKELLGEQTESLHHLARSIIEIQQPLEQSRRAAAAAAAM